MRIKLIVKSVTFRAKHVYVTFEEPYQERADGLSCEVQVAIPETDTQEWILLIGKEVLFERVRPLSSPRKVPVPDQSGA